MESSKADEIKILNFKPQKTIIYNKLLPYADELPEEALIQLQEIKENLSKAVVFRDIRPGCIHWVAKLSRYIKVYGLYFSKEDHILFVKLAYQLLIIPDQEFWVTGKFAQILNILLKKRELLSPDDLLLPWRPLAEVYQKLFHSSYKNLGMIMLPQNAEFLFKNTIRSCRPYFPLEATAEILNEWRPQFCPYDVSMYRAISFLELFLPTMLAPSKAHHGWKIWFDELMSLWVSFHNEPLWGSTLFCLFARLGWQNIGYINWEPYLPLIFTRILWQFHLPVHYKKVPVVTRRGLEIWAISMFIVSNLGGDSRTQKELDRLLKILESYFHPSNTGYWTRSLNDFQVKLTHYFVQRLHNERYRKPSWVTNVTDEKKLSEDDITAFVKCLQPAANISVFAKTGSYEAGVVLHRLALLRPEIIIPPLLEQLYSAMHTMTEPHRLIASLQCVVRVARPLVLGGKKNSGDNVCYPEGPSHVIPLLFEALPGIDPNDVNKCMVTFQFIATFVALVPLVDCSSAVNDVQDLNEAEQELCIQTAMFEEFVMQFIRRALGLIENLALEQSANAEREKEAMNLEENMIEIGLSSTFKTILTQSEPKIFDNALQCLLLFTKGRYLEPKVAGKFVATLWRSAAKVNPDKTLNAFLPSICRLIMTLTDNPDVVEDENIDNELLFNMLLLSELVQSRGKVLVDFVPKIMEVLQRTIHMKSRKGYKMATSIMRNLLWSLNLTVSSEVRSSVYSWDTPFTEFLPIKHWGEAGNIDNLKLVWNEPGRSEQEVIEKMVRTFLTPELILMRKYIAGETTLTRDRLHQSLCITQDVLYAGGSLPQWDEEPVSLMEMSVKKDPPPLKLRTQCLEVTLDCEELPSNVRKAVADVTSELVDFLLSNESDDTKSLNYASSIYVSVSFFYGVKRDEFEARWKSFERVKQSLSDSVVRKKQHIRALLIERTVLQYEIRILESCNPVFTQTHQKLLHSLLRLSTSHYSEVRKKSQNVLSQFFRQFSYSYKLVLPDLIEILKKDPLTNHKEIKGALYVILGSKEKSLIVRRDWSTLNVLCPALLSAQHAEKLSIVRLYDTLLKTVCRHFELFAIGLQVSDGAVEAARQLLNSENPSVMNTFIDPDQEANSIKQLQLKGEKNMDGYQSLVHKLADLLKSGTLHWRRMQVCLGFLGILVRPDVTFPSEGVKAMMSFMISDNIVLRKIVYCYLPCIFKNQKRRHTTIKIDPFSVNSSHSSTTDVCAGDNRPDNKWVQYDKESVNLTEEEWDSKVFVHRTWTGWYCWPKEVEVYAPASQQPPVNRSYEDLPEEEKAIYDFFIVQENVDKLISFLSLEETKGQDKFDSRKFFLFKGLFRNFGDTFLPQLEPHLHKLVADVQESNQRCAAEIIGGMVRGSKHWPYASTQKALDLTCKLLRVVFSKVLNETLEDWGACMTCISMDRDPNRFAPIIELLIEDPVPQGEASFLISSRLYLSQLFLEQQEWRIADCYHRLLKTLEPHLASPYKSIRDRIGLFLYRIFMRDENIANCNKTLSPHHGEFVDSLLPQLSLLIQECRRGGFFTPDLSPSHHPPPHPSMSSEGPILHPLSLPMESVGGSVLLREHDPSSRPESPKDSQEAPSGSSAPMRSHLDITGVLCSDKEGLPSVSLVTPCNNGFDPGDTEERKVALCLMNTVCKFVTSMATNINTSFPPDLYKLLPHLCQLESIDSDLELRNNCMSSLAYLSRTILTPEEVTLPINALKSIFQGGWWRARMAALTFLQVLVFHNMFTVLESGSADQVRQMVLEALGDARAEVRQMASQVLSGLFHSNFLPADEQILDEFTQKLNRGKRKKDKSGRFAFSSEVITERHCGALGLNAFISAYPYDVPRFMPEALVTLSQHIGDPQPISTDIKQALSHFKRTHHDNWNDHKKKFTTDQLEILTDVLVSPSYYV